MLVFLFTDIEGSTRLWEEHTQEMGGVISRHDAILRQQIGELGGSVVKGSGDSLSVGRCYRDTPEVDGLVFVQEELPTGEMTPVLITGAMEYDLIGVKA